ncbi:uncharacterized protein LOC102457410 [Pelodiscus sinensis]|uniref:uncharacterized protein LOC102457410 n=1 Tax=Pelodiscus sinensis TaxID=13735 RepID=UPI003F6D6AA5
MPCGSISTASSSTMWLCPAAPRGPRMSAPEAPRDPAPASQQPHQGSQQARRGTKRHAPCWSGAEVKALLDFWAQEESLHNPGAHHRKADTFSCMVQVLSDQGHPAWTLEQVRAKVKELRLGYVQATEGKGAGADTCPHYEHLHTILSETAVQGSSLAVDTVLHTLVVRPPGLEEEDSLTTGSKDEGEDRPITLHLEPVPSSWDASWALSEASNQSSAGPAGSEGPSSPAAVAAPTTQAPVQ